MDEIDEVTLEVAKKFKKYLRFEIGSIVYLKADLKKKCPMVISDFYLDSNTEDYHVWWTTTQKKLESISVKDKVLDPEIL